MFGLYLVALLSNALLSLFSVEERVINKEDIDDLKEYPEEYVSVLSKLMFWWMNSLIITGYKRDLTRQDLWRISEKESSYHITNRFENVWKKQANEYIQQIQKYPDELIETKNNKPRNRKHTENGIRSEEEQIKLNNYSNSKEDYIKLNKPSFGLALIKVFRGKFLAGSLLKIIYDLFQFVGPIILDKLIKFIKDKNQNLMVGIFLTAILFLSSFIQSLILQHHNQYMFIVSIRIRTAIMNVIYKKVFNV